MSCKISECTRFFLFSLIAMIATIIICGVVVRYDIQQDDVKRHRVDTVLMTVNISGKLDDRVVKKQIDSIFSTVMSNQEWVLKRQETLVNDVRQETNNSIDKLGIWAGVGLGLVGLFGCLIPMWQSTINRNELERSVKLELRAKKGELNTKMREVEDKIEREGKKQRREINDWLVRLRHQVTLSELQSAADCLLIGLDSHQLDNNAAVRSFLGDIWSKISKSFDKLVNLVKEDLDKLGDNGRNPEDDRLTLVHALEIIDEVLRRISVRVVDRGKQMECQLVEDRLRLVLSELCGATFRFEEEFVTSLDSLSTELGMLHIRL